MLLFRGVGDYDPTMAMPAMAILVHFWVVYWAIVPPTFNLRSNLPHCCTAAKLPGACQTGHCHVVMRIATRILFFATEVTQEPLSSVHYTHIKRLPNLRCVFRSGLADTTKMTPHSMATGLPDLAVIVPWCVLCRTAPFVSSVLFPVRLPVFPFFPPPPAAGCLPRPCHLPPLSGPPPPVSFFFPGLGLSRRAPAPALRVDCSIHVKNTEPHAALCCMLLHSHSHSPRFELHPDPPHPPPSRYAT